ncbi:MAG: OB-fold domain-containing protein [Acidimicrobiales bacterium]|nr:OB-fold domain-containing protein [Acidimicrobiales bacterium]
MRFDLPLVDEDSAPFWDGARHGRLMIMRCDDTGQHYFYPRPFSPFTWSTNVSWVQASGQATLYTWSVVHRNDLAPWHERVPYIAAVAELREGPRLQTILVGCEPEDLTIGMELEVDFEVRTDDLAVPVFRPARG